MGFLNETGKFLPGLSYNSTASLMKVPNGELISPSSWLIDWHKEPAIDQPMAGATEISPADFAKEMKKYLGKDKHRAILTNMHKDYDDWIFLKHSPESRRLVALPDFQEPLGLPTIQPSDTTHAVDNGEPEGMSLGTLAAVPVATVLIGFMLVSSVRALLKRFRKQEKRRERTSFDDNG